MMKPMSHLQLYTRTSCPGFLTLPRSHVPYPSPHRVYPSNRAFIQELYATRSQSAASPRRRPQHPHPPKPTAEKNPHDPLKDQATPHRYRPPGTSIPQSPNPSTTPRSTLTPSIPPYSSHISDIRYSPHPLHSTAQHIAHQSP